jgi:hypothetical protein
LIVNATHDGGSSYQQVMFAIQILLDKNGLKYSMKLCIVTVVFDVIGYVWLSDDTLDMFMVEMYCSPGPTFITDSIDGSFTDVFFSQVHHVVNL